MLKDKWNKLKQLLTPEGNLQVQDLGSLKGGPMIRKKIIFHGDVQGVGFRWRARESAQALGLTGWVQNEYDGTVTMEVQGTEAAIARMIGMIDAGSWIHIEEMETELIEIVPDERAFKVVGY